MSERQSYHGNIALGSGDIKQLSKSAAHYHFSKLFPFSGSKASDFGTVFHLMVLEPQKLKDEVMFCEENISFATKEGKALKAQNPNIKYFIKPDEGKILSTMSTRIAEMNKILSKDLLAECEKEKPIFWSEENGIKGKALFDAVNFDKKIIIDIKTTSKNPEKAAIEQEYHTQSAWYSRGISNILSCPQSDILFLFFVVQTEPPFEWRIFTVSDYNVGNDKVENALKNYKTWLEKPEDNPKNQIKALPNSWSDLKDE